MVRARLLDAAGLPEEGMRCWRKAAKCGHLEGQLLFGLALYRGTAGVAPDAEDAHLWLSKALKQVGREGGVCVCVGDMGWYRTMQCVCGVEGTAEG